MIEQNVQVVRCRDKRIRVRMGSQAGCSACENGKGCGAGVFAKLFQRKPVELELARNGMEVEAGQMLTLAFPEHVYMKMVFAIYGWPLLAALAGAIAAYGLGTWLQAGAVLVDMVTLSGGLLAAGLAVRLLRDRGATKNLLNSLQTTVYYPADTPNMCSRRMTNST